MLTHRLHRLLVLSTGLRDYGIEQLLTVIREQRYPPLLRVAALRRLIHGAPLDVTRGAPYLQRRRYVRRHYGV
jgi:hypothetical protein